MLTTKHYNQPSLTRLMALYYYRDGMVFHAKTRYHTVAHERAGVTLPDGYRRLKVEGFPILEHRAIFAMIHGRWPNGEIDHIDGNPANNHIENLRDVAPSENQQNRREHRNGRPIGVAFHVKSNRWFATAPRNYLNRKAPKVKYVGCYKTMEEAAKRVVEYCSMENI